MNLDVSTPNVYGPLQAGFTFGIKDGYQVLTGPNNAGKSAILQMVFKTVFRQGGEMQQKIALLLPDRDHVMPTLQTGGRELISYSSELHTQIDAQPLMYDSPRGPARNELTALLLGHTDLMSQVEAVNQYLNLVGLPNLLVKRGQQIYVAENILQQQGTGMRSLLTILSALTDTDLALILVDEPEVSLEPRLQKSLRDLLIDTAKGRTILVATHSHLFLNRQQPSANHRVTRDTGGAVSVQTLATQEDLFDTAFDLLGSDTEDLFFPGNYWVVEGAFDQAICQRILGLLNVRNTRVKVIVAGGITKVGPILSAVINSLTPLTLNDSPYARRVVVLIDRPTAAQANQTTEVQRILSDRLFVLDVDTMEEYVPDDVYRRATRDKAAEINQVKTIAASGDYKALTEYKRQLSEALAASMTAEDVDRMPIVKAAAARAANF